MVISVSWPVIVFTSICFPSAKITVTKAKIKWLWTILDERSCDGSFCFQESPSRQRSWRKWCHRHWTPRKGTSLTRTMLLWWLRKNHDVRDLKSMRESCVFCYILCFVSFVYFVQIKKSNNLIQESEFYFESEFLVYSFTQDGFMYKWYTCSINYVYWYFLRVCSVLT